MELTASLRRFGGKASGRTTGEGILRSSWQAHERKGERATICPGIEASGWPQGVSRGRQESRKLEWGLGKALLCAQACSPNTVSLETKEPFSLGFDAAISGWQCQVVGAPGGVNPLPPHQLLGPLGLDVGEVGVPCYVAIATTPTPTFQSTKRDRFHPHPQEEPGSG